MTSSATTAPKPGWCRCRSTPRPAPPCWRRSADDPTLEVTVDLERLVVSAPAAGIEAPFPLDAFTQHRLLEGLDDIGLTLRHGGDIDAYEKHRPAWLPTITA